VALFQLNLRNIVLNLEVCHPSCVVE